MSELQCDHHSSQAVTTALRCVAGYCLVDNMAHKFRNGLAILSSMRVPTLFDFVFRQFFVPPLAEWSCWGFREGDSRGVIV